MCTGILADITHYIATFIWNWNRHQILDLVRSMMHLLSSCEDLTRLTILSIGELSIKYHAWCSMGNLLRARRHSEQTPHDTYFLYVDSSNVQSPKGPAHRPGRSAITLNSQRGDADPSGRLHGGGCVWSLSIWVFTYSQPKTHWHHRIRFLRSSTIYKCVGGFTIAPFYEERPARACCSTIHRLRNSALQTDVWENFELSCLHGIRLRNSLIQISTRGAASTLSVLDNPLCLVLFIAIC